MVKAQVKSRALFECQVLEATLDNLTSKCVELNLFSDPNDDSIMRALSALQDQYVVLRAKIEQSKVE